MRNAGGMVACINNYGAKIKQLLGRLDDVVLGCPNAPNRPELSSSRYRPGEPRAGNMVYRFGTEPG